MHWLAFLSTVIYYPEVTGAVIHPGWALLSCVLCWMVWHRAVGWFQTILFFLFAGYAIASLAWTDKPMFSVDTLWHILIFLAAWWIGTAMLSLEKVAIGLAIGLTLSSLLTIPQWFGWEGILQWDPNHPAGILYSPLAIVNSITFTITLLITYRRWAYIPALIPGLLIPHERAGLVSLFAFAIAWTWQRWRWWALALLLAIPLAWALRNLGDPDRAAFGDPMRWVLWKILLTHLHWWGNGVDAVDRIGLVYHSRLFFPEFAHNEPLDFIYQFGLGSIPLLVLLALPILKSNSEEWPAYCAFLVLSFFSIPLHNPTTALAGGLLAGCISAERDFSWYRGRAWGPSALVWMEALRSAVGRSRRRGLPIQQNPLAQES